MNDEGPDLPAAVTTKSLGKFVGSNDTIPVGWNGVPLTAFGGSATSSFSFVPFPSYSDELLVPLFAIQTGSLAAKTSPHALTRFASWVAATPDPSATSAFTAKTVAGLTVRVVV